MTAYSNQVKSYIQRYRKEAGDTGLLDPHTLAEWAYKHGLHKPNAQTIIDSIAKDIAQVFREEYRTDRYGRGYATYKNAPVPTYSDWNVVGYYDLMPATVTVAK